MSKLVTALRDPKLLVLKLMWGGYFDWLTDKHFVELQFLLHMGHLPNLREPKTFNEKIQWMKLYDHNTLYNELVDKYEVKKFVANKIGEEYIVPNYGLWEKVSEINVDELPRSFVLKTTHDWQGVYVVDDKQKLSTTEWNSIYCGLEEHLNYNLFNHNKEWAYKDVRPRIIAEKNLSLTDGNQKTYLVDYKFFCFNGSAICLLVCTDRVNGLANYFYLNRKGDLLPYNEQSISAKARGTKPLLPKNIEKMWNIAEKLSEGLRQVRVDLYSVDDQVFVGELTLYDSAGYDTDRSEEADKELGKLFNV